MDPDSFCHIMSFKITSASELKETIPLLRKIGGPAFPYQCLKRLFNYWKISPHFNSMEQALVFYQLAQKAKIRSQFPSHFDELEEEYDPDSGDDGIVIPQRTREKIFNAIRQDRRDSLRDLLRPLTWNFEFEDEQTEHHVSGLVHYATILNKLNSLQALIEEGASWTWGAVWSALDKKATDPFWDVYFRTGGTEALIRKVAEGRYYDDGYPDNWEEWLQEILDTHLSLKVRRSQVSR